MIRQPLRRPAPPNPEMTLPAIKMLDELAVAQTMEPTSNITMQHANTHWNSKSNLCLSCRGLCGRRYLVAKTHVKLSGHRLQNCSIPLSQPFVHNRVTVSTRSEVHIRCESVRAAVPTDVED